MTYKNGVAIARGIECKTRCGIILSFVLHRCATNIHTRRNFYTATCTVIDLVDVPFIFILLQ